MTTTRYSTTVVRRTSAALALLLIILTAAETAQAQTSVKLVGNTGQSNDSNSSFRTDYDDAGGFTTGRNSEGYKLTSVDLGVLLAAPLGTTEPQYTVSIWSSNSSGHPGSNLGTLTNPASLVQGTNSFAAATGIDLDAQTTYWVVVDTTAVGDRQSQLRRTVANAEDAGAATGWSIADAGLQKHMSDSWTEDELGHSTQFAVHGHAKDESAPTLVGGTIRGQTVKLYFSELLKTAGGPAAGQFTVTGNPTNLGAVTSATIDTSESNIITLMVTNASAAADTVTVTIPTTTGIEDLAGNSLAAITTAFTLTNINPDDPGAPLLTAASVNARTLTLTYNQKLLPRYPPAADFTVSASTTSVSVDKVALTPGSTSSTVALALSLPVKHGETVTVSYSKATKPRLQNEWGSQVTALSIRAVTNATDPPVVLIKSAGDGQPIEEGQLASFSLNIDPVPVSEVQVEVTISQTGTFVASEHLGARTVSMPTTQSHIFNVPTVHNGADQADGAVTATLVAGTGYTVHATKNAFTTVVRDIDASPPAPPAPPSPSPSRGSAPAASAGADVEVDPGASVTLNASRSSDPDGDALAYAWEQVSGAAVTLSGANTARAAFTAPAAPGALEFRLTVTDPGGLSDSDVVTVTVRDLAPSFGDAAVAALVLVSGEAMAPVVLPEAAGGNGALSYSLTSEPTGLAGLNFDAAARRLSGRPGTEGSWVFTWRAHDADANRADADAATLTFRVTVDDSGAAMVKHTVRRTLSAVAGRALSSALDNIGARIETSVPASGLTLAGETLPLGLPAARLAGACAPDARGRHGFGTTFGQAGFGAARDGCAPDARGRSVAAAELLHASAFSLTPGAAQAAPSALLWSVWARGDLGTFAGRPEPGIRYEGELRTGWLGMDVRAGAWVAGLAVSHGTGEADYRFEERGMSRRGRLQTSLTALYPYASWTVVDGLELRGVLGAGLGEAVHRLDGDERETSELSIQMVSLGLRHELPALARIDLAARADASLARMATGDGPDYVDGVTATTWRLRAGLEASRRFALGGDTALAPVRRGGRAARRRRQHHRQRPRNGGRAALHDAASADGGARALARVALGGRRGGARRERDRAHGARGARARAVAVPEPALGRGNRRRGGAVAGPTAAIARNPGRRCRRARRADRLWCGSHSARAADAVRRDRARRRGPLAAQARRPVRRLAPGSRRRGRGRARRERRGRAQARAQVRPQAAVLNRAAGGGRRRGG